MMVFIPGLLLIDIVYDSVFKELVWSKTFATDNLFFKILAAIAGAYFYATFDTAPKKN